MRFIDCVECVAKGIGLTLEEALEFWRSEFTQKISNQVFEKQYAYNIRYLSLSRTFSFTFIRPHICTLSLYL
jgi:hypothetical protein